MRARFSFIHTLKSGSTSIVDVGGPETDPERYVEMVDGLGIRCVTGLRFRDANLLLDEAGRIEYDWSDERGHQGLARAAEFADTFDGVNDGRLIAMLFPGQVDTCTPELLAASGEAAGDLGVKVQIHAAMNLIEFHEIMRRHRCTPVELLDRIGLLGPHVSLSHCLFLSGHSWTAYPHGDDVKLLAESGASVAHCPLKYLKLGVALESFDALIGAGVNVALGTDTFPRDIISEMRYAAFASRLVEGSFTSGSPRDVFNAATLGGANLLGRTDLGRLAPGAKADIVVINMTDMAFGPVHDPIHSLIETGTGRDVGMVIVDGEVLVEGGHYLRADEDELLHAVQEDADRQWDDLPNWHWTGRSIDEVMPPAFKLV